MQIHEDIGIVHNIVGTDAGSIDFGFLNGLAQIPGLLHRIAHISKIDSVFVLENGSKWSSPNIEMIDGWVNHQLMLTQNQALFSTYRFALVDLELEKAVPVSLQREPFPVLGKGSFFITKIDYANDVVTLDNGREWSVYSHDHGTLRKFSEHDRVMIGANTSDTMNYSLMKNYILIDTASNLYVRSNLIFTS
jgi:hypothetical protein